MARGKHSTALFEVINSGKKPPGAARSATGKPLEGKAAAASLMRTPKWWFKGATKPVEKPEAAAPPAAVSNDPTANVTATTLNTARPPIAPSAASTPAVEPVRADTVEAARAERVERMVPVEESPGEPAVVVHDYSDPEPIVTERFTEPEPDVVPTVSSRSTAQASYARSVEPAPDHRNARVARVAAPVPRRRESSRSAVHFGVDRDSQEITLRMRYTAAIVSGFVVLVLIGSAYVVGRHIGESRSTAGSTALSGLSTGQIKIGPADPKVIDVGRDRAHLAAAKINGTQGAVEPFEDAPIDSAGIADRNANPDYLNFVLITTFPPEKSEAAIKARDFLCNHGIICTLERDVPKEPAHWLSVVGTRGFPRKFMSSRDYVTYRDTIVALNEKFPSKSNFGRFDPMPFKWDGH